MTAARSKKVPRYVSERYEGGAHGFRSEKRRQAKRLRKLLGELRMGCAYFPCTERPIDEITRQLDIIQKAISVKEWGR